MKSKKDQFSKTFAFVLILVAFIASLVIGINGTRIRIHNYIESKKPKPIVLHEFYEDNKLWYYRPGTYEIQGTYECNGKGIYCGYAYELVDDSSYSLRYYLSNTIIYYSQIIAGDYSFIVDAENTPEEGDTQYRNEKIKLLKISSGEVISEFSAVKSYSELSGINESFIVRDLDGKWGVIQVTATGPEGKVPFIYDYIGMHTYNQNELPSVINKYVAKKGNSWYVIDNTGKEIISGVPEPIYGYEGTVAITKDSNDKYNVYSANGEKINTLTEFDDVLFTGTGYVVGAKDSYRYSIYDNTGKEVKDGILFPRDSIDSTVEGDMTIIKINNIEVFSGKNLSNKGNELTQMQ